MDAIPVGVSPLPISFVPRVRTADLFMLTYEISVADHGRRVESFLQNLLPGAPPAYLKKLLRSGHLALNGTPASPDAALRRTDRLTLKESGRTLSFLGVPHPDLDILYEDDRIVAVNKPAGLPMHRTAEFGEQNLVDVAQSFMRWRGDVCSLRPVNRLDRGTSGAVILAKSSLAAGMFGRLVKEEGLGKLYLAMAEGVAPESGSMTEPLDGKESETRYRRLALLEGASLLALYPVTGRMHQIRRHLLLIGHPVLGDLRYGASPLPGWCGHALHSFRTHATHPENGSELLITAPLPAEFIACLSRSAGDDAGRLLDGLPDLPTTLG
jgi:23S rRNA pseudouridine955/2504/2580 synthase